MSDQREEEYQESMCEYDRGYDTGYRQGLRENRAQELEERLKELYSSAVQLGNSAACLYSDTSHPNIEVLCSSRGMLKGDLDIVNKQLTLTIELLELIKKV